jgi:hypothetical protein
VANKTSKETKTDHVMLTSEVDVTRNNNRKNHVAKQKQIARVRASGKKISLCGRGEGTFVLYRITLLVFLVWYHKVCCTYILAIVVVAPYSQ